MWMMAIDGDEPRDRGWWDRFVSDQRKVMVAVMAAAAVGLGAYIKTSAESMATMKAGWDAFLAQQEADRALDDQRQEQMRAMQQALRDIQVHAGEQTKLIQHLMNQQQQTALILREHDIDIATLKERTDGE